MAKVVDITEKLNFDENPSLLIKGKKIEVNASAETVIRIMGKFSEGDVESAKTTLEMFELIFTEEAREEIAKMKLQFDDFCTVVNAAVELIIGDNEEEQGE